MDKQTITEIIYKIIEENNIIPINCIASEDTSLYEECGLTSVGIIDLIVSLEEYFGYEFTNDELILNNFETINNISDIVYKRLG